MLTGHEASVEVNMLKPMLVASLSHILKNVANLAI